MQWLRCCRGFPQIEIEVFFKNCGFIVLISLEYYENNSNLEFFGFPCVRTWGHYIGIYQRTWILGKSSPRGRNTDPTMMKLFFQMLLLWKKLICKDFDLFEMLRMLYFRAYSLLSEDCIFNVPCRFQNNHSSQSPLSRYANKNIGAKQNFCFYGGCFTLIVHAYVFGIVWLEESNCAPLGV